MNMRYQQLKQHVKKQQEIKDQQKKKKDKTLLANIKKATAAANKATKSQAKRNIENIHNNPINVGTPGPGSPGALVTRKSNRVPVPNPKYTQFSIKTLQSLNCQMSKMSKCL